MKRMKQRGLLIIGLLVKIPQSKSWIRVKNCVEQPSQLATLNTYIRKIHHPKITKMRCLRKGNCNSLYKKWKF